MVRLAAGAPLANKTTNIFVAGILPSGDGRKRGMIPDHADFIVIDADFRDDGSEICLLCLNVPIVDFVAHEVGECRDALRFNGGAL